MKKPELVFGRARIAMVVLLFLLLALSTTAAYADQWTETFGGEKADSAVSVQQTSDGGYILLGSAVSFSMSEGLSDVWGLKLDMLGQIEWQKTFRGDGTDEGVAIRQTAEGGYIIGANTDSFGSGKTDIWLLKIDETGVIEWQKTYGGEGDDKIYDLQQTSDGGYVIAGSTDSSGAGKTDIWILKLGETGAIEWQKTYGGAEDESASSIKETSDGGYIVGGTTASFGAGGQDFWVLKLNGDGTIKWQKAYGSTADEECSAILKIKEKVGEEEKERYIVAGSSNSFGFGSLDAWVLKLDEKGNILWQKTYGGNLGDERAHSIQQTSDEGYVLVGQTGSFGAGLEDAWILKLDANGNIQWQKTYGGEKSDIARYIIQTLDEGYALVGSTESSGAGDQDLWMLKLDFSGNIADCPKEGTAAASTLTTTVTAIITSATVQNTGVSPQASEGSSAVTSIAPDAQCLVQGPEIAIAPTSVTYEPVIVGRTAFQTVTLSNTGSQDLVIETLDITGMDDLSFAIDEDKCSGKTLCYLGEPSSSCLGERSCTVEILFLPTTEGQKSAFLHVPSNDPVKGDAYLSLDGKGILPITLAGPANHAAFSGCSMFDFPTFSWETVESFKKYQIEFSPFSSFSTLSMIFKSSKTKALMYAGPWAIALRTPGGTGGAVYWRVVGFRRDGTAFISDSRVFIVEPAEPVGSPEISDTSKSSLPTISWENNCNTKFRAVFGSNSQFSKSTSISLKVKKPTEGDGKFTATLKQNQWKSIRKLVQDESGATIYWKVESIDAANRSAVTRTMSFVLAD